MKTSSASSTHSWVCPQTRRRSVVRARIAMRGAPPASRLAGRAARCWPAGTTPRRQRFGVDVVDPVGTGDAFAAAFLHGILMDWPVARIARLANEVGAFVAGTHGAIPAAVPQQVVRR